MPKIKIKNISIQKVNKICGFYRYYFDCRDCPLHNNENKCYRTWITDPNYVIELSEKDFPTNREWLESLSDEDLAAFYTLGIPLKDNFYINLYRVAMSFTSSQQGIKEWLSQPCKYLMEE